MALIKQPRISSPVRHHRGYAAELIAFCQRHHLMGFAIPLTEILIEPRFVQKIPLIAPIDENLTKSVMFRIPHTHEYPALYGAYNITTHSLEEVGLGGHHVAIQGIPGSGRTTALLALALYAMNAVAFPPPKDAIQERLAAEEKKLKPEERAERVKRNVQLAQKTREGLASIQGRGDVDIMTQEEATTAAQEGLRTLAPFYVHMADISLKSAEYGSVVDPAEPLVRALQARVSYVTAQMMPPTVYDLLGKGRALVLIDGLDQIAHTARADMLAWLKAFMEQYSNNRIVVTSGVNGSFELQAIGFHTTFIRPWDDLACETFYQKVSTKAASFSLPTGEAQARWLHKARLLPVREIVLSLLYPTAASPRDRIHQYLSQTLPTGVDVDYVTQLAAVQLRQGFIRLEDAPKPQEAPPTTDEPAPTTDEPAPASNSKARRADPNAEPRAKLQALTKSGLLTRTRNGRFRFAYPSIMAALAAATITQEEVMAQLDNPDWALVLCYANSHLNMESACAAVLSSEPTVNLAHLLRPAQWLPHAGQAEWVKGYLRLLAHWMLQPNQYLHARQAIAAALLMSGDPTVKVVFRRMLSHANPDCRQVAALALGAIRDVEATDPLYQIVNNPQEDLEIQITATLALGALRTDTATQYLVELLKQHPSSDVKRAAAESLAALPDAGYPVLFEAVRSSDPYVRRAVVWGLGRIGTDWSLIALNEIFLEDKETYVRLAVHQVYAERYEVGALGIRNYPPLSKINWAQEWADRAIANNIIPNTREPQPLVIASIQQRRDPQISVFFIILAGQLGFLWAHNALYKALFDPQPAIRDYAYRSLWELAQGWNVRLPLPT